MCPSKVPFGDLMDDARVQLETHRKSSIVRRLVRKAALRIAASPASTQVFTGALRVYQQLGLQTLVANLDWLPARLRRLNHLLPTRFNGALTTHATETASRTSVHLFRGCASGAFDQQTLAASQRLLTRLGYQVEVPKRQRCCGALHQHNGDLQTSARLAAANDSAFPGKAPILVTASACAAHLRDYGRLFEHSSFAVRVNELLHFLLHQAPQTPEFNAFPYKVAVHVPCSHRNALKQSQEIFDILNWIPGLETVVVNPAGGCCGAAGSYLLSQPVLSDQFGNQMVDKVLASGANIVLTTNIGCSIQFQAGLKERGVDIEVLHPVVLLERCLVTQNCDQRIAPTGGSNNL